MLTHTSGLSYGFLPDNIASIYRSKEILLHSSVSLKDEVENISCCPLLFEPGSKWNYSVSSDILAYIIECAADMELEDVLENYLLKEIGIKDISFKVLSTPEHRRIRNISIRMSCPIFSYFSPLFI